MRSKDIPATQGMLHLVRRELKSEIRSSRSHSDSRFNTLESRFKDVDARFAQVDARFNQVMGAIHQLTSEVARIGTLVEEQNSRNQIVLEALTGIYQRQDRVESRMDRVEELVHSIAIRSKE